MEWFQIVGAAVTVLVLAAVMSRLRRAGGHINKIADDVEQWLASQGFEVVERWPGSAMDAALHMRKRSEVEVDFFLGHRATQGDRPDRKILGSDDAQFARSWWLHTTATLPKGEEFRAVVALRRRHESTKVVWGYIKPEKWNVVSHSTGDAEFDTLFETLVERSFEKQEVLDEATRAAILRLRHDPYFENMLLLISPHRRDCLTLINPPLPSPTNPSIDVLETLAQRLS